MTEADVEAWDAQPVLDEAGKPLPTLRLTLGDIPVTLPAMTFLRLGLRMKLDVERRLASAPGGVKALSGIGGALTGGVGGMVVGGVLRALVGLLYRAYAGEVPDAAPPQLPRGADPLDAALAWAGPFLLAVLAARQWDVQFDETEDGGIVITDVLAAAPLADSGAQAGAGEVARDADAGAAPGAGA